MRRFAENLDDGQEAKSKTNQKRIFDEFRTSHPAHMELAPVPLEQLTPDQLASAPMWARYATYLVHPSGYKIGPGRRNAGQPLDLRPALAAWSGCINQARALVKRPTPEQKVKAPRHARPYTLCSLAPGHARRSSSLAWTRRAKASSRSG